MRHLRTHVHVQDEHGVSVAFGPHDDVPSWAADKITNPKAWDDDPADADQTEPASDRDAADRPPTSGPGSSRGAWAAYAASLGYEIENGATKADIIAAIDGTS